MSLITTQTAITITETSYSEDVGGGTFACSLITVSDASASMYTLSGGLRYTGRINIVEGTTSEEVRIIEVSGTNIYTELLVNEYTDNTAELTFYGYTGTPGVGELAKNSTSVYLYPSVDKAEETTNQDREDIYYLSGQIETAKLPLYNISQGCIIQKDPENSSLIRLVGTSNTPIAFAQDEVLFLEDSEKTLDVTLYSDGFYGIYITEDTDDDPFIENTLPLKLHSISITTPSTAPSITDHYLIGYIYVYDGEPIGIYNLEKPNFKSNYQFRNNGLGFVFDENYGSTGKHDICTEKYMIFPVFFDSHVLCEFQTYVRIMNYGSIYNEPVHFAMGLMYSTSLITTTPDTISSGDKVAEEEVRPNWSLDNWNMFIPVKLSGRIELTPGIYKLWLYGAHADPLGLPTGNQASYLTSKIEGSISVLPSEFVFNSGV